MHRLRHHLSSIIFLNCHIATRYIHFKANRKKAEERKTGSGPAVSPLTPVEELVISINRGRPMMEGIPGGTSSEPSTSREEQNELAQCIFPNRPTPKSLMSNLCSLACSKMANLKMKYPNIT